MSVKSFLGRFPRFFELFLVSQFPQLYREGTRELQGVENDELYPQVHWLASRSCRILIYVGYLVQSSCSHNRECSNCLPIASADIIVRKYQTLSSRLIQRQFKTVTEKICGQWGQQIHDCQLSYLGLPGVNFWASHHQKFAIVCHQLDSYLSRLLCDSLHRILSVSYKENEPTNHRDCILHIRLIFRAPAAISKPQYRGDRGILTGRQLPINFSSLISYG